MAKDSFKDKIKKLITLETDENIGIKNNPVANFSYTSKAYAENKAQGVEAYDFAQDQNIPVATTKALDTNGTVLTKGYRSQGASLSRMLVNHFFGRTSYNLNKIHDWFTEFLNIFLNDFMTQGVWDLTLETYTEETNFDEMITPGARKGKKFIGMTGAPIKITESPSNFADWECVVIRGDTTYRQLLFYTNIQTSKTYLAIRSGVKQSIGVSWKEWSTSSDYAEEAGNAETLNKHPDTYFATNTAVSKKLDTATYTSDKSKLDASLQRKADITAVNAIFELSPDGDVLYITPIPTR